MQRELGLVHGNSRAVISPRGAEILSWQVDGREWIWSGDARWWARRAPVLFPFNGWLNGGEFRVRGQRFSAGVHGFGSDSDFTLEPINAAQARLHLRDSDRTRAQFPFAFALEITVQLEARGLDIAFEVRNPGTERLPYAIGFHPGFAWPFDGGEPAAYRLEFEKAESFDCPEIAPGGLFMDRQVQGLPMVGRRLDIATALSDRDSLVFRNTASRRLDFVAPTGRRLQIEAEHFPHWVIWRKPGGNYLCIESWSGQGDPVGFAGDITQKPGMTLLPPGDHRSYRFRATLV